MDTHACVGGCGVRLVDSRIRVTSVKLVLVKNHLYSHGCAFEEESREISPYIHTRAYLKAHCAPITNQLKTTHLHSPTLLILTAN